MTAMPVRTLRGPLHLCKPTGRGYATACGRFLTGPDLVVAPRHRWAHVWQLELACKRCEALAERARNDRELDRIAHW